MPYVKLAPWRCPSQQTRSFRTLSLPILPVILAHRMHYTIQVDIDTKKLPILRQKGYKLCIAKQVNGQYNVVWTAGDHYLRHNTFEWKENYQVFGTQHSGPMVKQYTAQQDISCGQTCVLAGDILEPATGIPDDSGIFYFDYRNGSLRPGINCHLRSLSFSPIFVSLHDSPGIASLAPTPTLLVWFDLELNKSEIIDKEIQNCVEVPYAPKATCHTIAFDGHWIIEDQLGQVATQPRRSYNRSTGFKDEDSGPDPYAFIDATHHHLVPTATDVVYPSYEWLAECKLSFPTANDADNARAYLKSKMIYNIHQLVSDMMDDVTFHVKLKWAHVMFIPETMAVSTDEEKIQNAFNAELKLLAVAPTSSQYITNDPTNIVPFPCVLLAYETRLSLDRDTDSKTAVVGDEYDQGSPSQKWTLVASTKGYFNIEGVAGGTYLSIDGEPTSGTLVIHGPDKMDWKVEFVGDSIRISVPDTNYCVELSGIIVPDSEKNVHMITLADATDETEQLWRILYPPTMK